MGPEEVCLLIPGTCDCCDLTGQGDCVGLIKCWVLRHGASPGRAWWAPCGDGGPYRGIRRTGQVLFCSVLMEADGGAMCFEDGERGSKPRNVGRFQKHLRQGASRRNAALDFSSMRLISGF